MLPLRPIDDAVAAAAAAAAASAALVSTRTGVSIVAVLPVPSCPAEPSPQAHMLPAASTTSVCDSPAAAPTTLMSRSADTRRGFNPNRGVYRRASERLRRSFAAVRCRKRPWPSFDHAPQVKTRPRAVTATVKPPPHATQATLSGAPCAPSSLSASSPFFSSPPSCCCFRAAASRSSSESKSPWRPYRSLSVTAIGTHLLCVVPSPSALPSPHVKSCPSVVIAAVWAPKTSEPHAAAATRIGSVSPKCSTMRGCWHEAVSPWPSAPSAPLPHVKSSPTSVTAAQWYHDAATDVTRAMPSCVPNRTRAGAGRPTSSPRPSTPNSPTPQEYTDTTVGSGSCSSSPPAASAAASAAPLQPAATPGAAPAEASSTVASPASSSRRGTAPAWRTWLRRGGGRSSSSGAATGSTVSLAHDEPPPGSPVPLAVGMLPVALVPPSPTVDGRVAVDGTLPRPPPPPPCELASALAATDPARLPPRLGVPVEPAMRACRWLALCTPGSSTSSIMTRASANASSADATVPLAAEPSPDSAAGPRVTRTAICCTYVTRTRAQTSPVTSSSLFSAAPTPSPPSPSSPPSTADAAAAARGPLGSQSHSRYTDTARTSAPRPHTPPKLPTPTVMRTGGVGTGSPFGPASGTMTTRDGLPSARTAAS
mmetsp:Transcript_24755/g.86184  ORF Transcript_24755/g.86184 Transcript_24755/m.86184 type:complete len:651 (-) Transcript_24755:944-2896(-)